MFSPATRKSDRAPHGDWNLGRRGGGGAPDSPSTPLPDNRRSAVPNRPATGTPAPWSSRLSVLARVPSVKQFEKEADVDQTQPVYVGEFPKVVRDAQTSFLRKPVVGGKFLAGGMDKETSLSWIICGNQLFIWSYLSSSISKRCSVLKIPFTAIDDEYLNTKSKNISHWRVCILRWEIASENSKECNSAGVVISNQKTQTLVYWPDIYSERGIIPIISQPTSPEQEEADLRGEGRKDGGLNQEGSFIGSSYFFEQNYFTSIIASAIPGYAHECIVIACQSNGDLWHFHFTPSKIYRKKISQGTIGGSRPDRSQMNKGYARSLIWRLQHVSPDEPGRQFFLLTDCGIQCWNVMLSSEVNAIQLWTHEIIGNDGDLGIKKDLAGQKHIWLLDMQVDSRGKELTILVATFCMDRVSSSSYTQYSLLTMQYRSGQDFASGNSGLMNEQILEKKAPLQVIIPKARVEDEDSLFTMRLRVGGRPAGSAVILSGDGTATVTIYSRGSTRLYKFDLPWDAGKVLDSSVLPSAEDSEEGAWIVLTEKAGVWAIPEKAVLLHGVEPPERSLSRKGSLNEGAVEEDKRSQAFASNMVPRRASSEVWSAGDRQKAVVTSIALRTAQDEEAEALLGRLFHDFMLSGEVEGTIEKLRVKGAFEKEGEMNVFARMSKSIVDTFAKHWTTTRGAEFVASAVVSSLLMDKQQRHHKYLQFLALSKCHEELSSRQRHSLLTIMEHGEKLSGMIQLRELQNLLSQNPSREADSLSSYSQNHVAGALWDLIQFVGEKARRNTVILMDRDNAEVFYSKVSDIEELFNCLSHNLLGIIGGEQTHTFQMHRAYEIANVCITLIQSAMQYRHEHQTWYPSPEGLTPWNGQHVVRSGLWSIASLIMQLLKEASAIDIPVKADLWSQLQGLTDVLLEGYSGCINAKSERGEEHKGLVEEYFRRRDELLHSLYELAKRFAYAKYQDSCKDVEDLALKDSIFREVSSPLLTIAKRHGGYQTLWNICYHLNDTGLLRSFMHGSIGPKGGFCYYVFKQLIKSKLYTKLLRLGEEFQEELANFLKDYKHFLWLHELFLNQFSSASETLHDLALSQDDGSNSLAIEEQGPVPIKMMLSLADRRRLLNLSKIASAAGKDEDYEMKIKRIEADLHILKLQEEIVNFFLDNNESQDFRRPLLPRELIEMCLKGESRELSLLAFDVFAWTSSSFRSSNRNLLEECWKNAADQNDWVALCQASTAEGWSDEVVLETLRESILFKASYRCYGPEAETYDGSFDDVLPLQKEDVEFPDSSVEGILMQHKDFPDAGKLMWTAIKMGKVGISGISEEVAVDSL